MTTIERLATFIAELEPANVDDSVLRAGRIHVFDTLCAAHVGARVADTVPVTKLVSSLGASGEASVLGQPHRTTLPLAALLGCVATRCTEIDDIHMPSCTTPGSVVVPTAYATASAGHARDDARFLAACLAGYEIVVRFGLAIDGARVLYRGIWPTYLAAGFGVAATVGKIIGLRTEQLANALAIASTLAVGTTGGRVGGLTSRWFTLGCAVQSATLACLAAASGMEGDVSLLDGRWSEITGVRLDATPLTRELGERFHICEVSFKPICSAKQATAATYALRSLLAEGTRPSEIARVLVEVPAAYAKMIDQPELPGNRLASIANVRYQLALAAYAPERLSDAVREQLLANDQIAAFVEKIEVRADPELERYYPRAYPARVTLTLGSGAEKSREIRDAPGDPGTGFGWDEVAAKYPMLPSAVRDACSALGERGSVDALFQALAGAFGVATPRD
jgi:2-methylcitrate dehydratase PrpD